MLHPEIARYDNVLLQTMRYPYPSRNVQKLSSDSGRHTFTNLVDIVLVKSSNFCVA